MKKILYIMHIDWKWSKQRPHFIAEGLSNFYDINIVYFYSKRYLFGNSGGSTINKDDLNLLRAFRLPLYQKKFIYVLNKIYMKIYFKHLIEKYDPDFIWITFPQLYDYIPSNSRCKIIYDCMDEAISFGFPKYFESKIRESEKKLVQDASIVFVSSNNLFKNLDENYSCNDKLVIVRNAFGGEIINDTFRESKIQENFKIGYVGTISKWIDFDKIKITLDNIKNIEYHFIGPYEPENVLKHDKIKYYGSINHELLYEYVKKFDCLILPFKINKLIESADPVKLYEYINFNKPIISVYYKELDYFSSFLYFYSSDKDILNYLIDMTKEGFTRKYSDDERIKFLTNNSWDVRINKIVEYIKRL